MGCKANFVKTAIILLPKVIFRFSIILINIQSSQSNLEKRRKLKDSPFPASSLVKRQVTPRVTLVQGWMQRPVGRNADFRKKPIH